MYRNAQHGFTSVVDSQAVASQRQIYLFKYGIQPGKMIT